MLRSLFSVGYALLPPGKADNLSDSSHSEISSRSSICSVDSVPTTTTAAEDPRSCTTRTAAAATASTAAASTSVPESSPAVHTHPNMDYNQPSTR